MADSNKPANSTTSRVVGGIAAAWFLSFFIYGAFIANNTTSRGICAVVAVIGLTIAMTACFWNGAAAHHKGGGEDLE